MVDIPDDLLRRSAEAEAKARGVPVDQVLAEMKEGRPVTPVGEGNGGPSPKEMVTEAGDRQIAAMSEAEADAATPGDDRPAPPDEPVTAQDAPEPPAEDDSGPEEDAQPEAPPQGDQIVEEPAAAKVEEPAGAEVEEPVAAEVEEPAAAEVEEPAAAEVEEPAATEAEEPAAAEVEEPAAAEVEEPAATEAEEPAAAEAVEPAAVATAVEEPKVAPPPTGDGAGNGKVAGVVSSRPVVPPAGLPEGVRTQRLLTVVKAGAIQKVKPEPTDKVNTWPHLMLMEFGALLLITGILVIMAVVIHSPLLDPANFNATPNPSKAPWYFLGLQELLSYFDPQIAGVMVPLFIGMIGFMFIPYVDKNPSTRPTDRKFAIMLYSLFLAGSATLTIIGVLFRGRGFNWAYPWQDGIFFDDLKDWVHFE